MLLNHWYVFKLFNLGIVCQKSNYGYSKWCNLCALCSRDIKKMVSLNPSIQRAPKMNCFLESDVKKFKLLTIAFMDIFIDLPV